MTYVERRFSTSPQTHLGDELNLVVARQVDGCVPPEPIGGGVPVDPAKGANVKKNENVPLNLLRGVEKV